MVYIVFTVYIKDELLLVHGLTLTRNRLCQFALSTHCDRRWPPARPKTNWSRRVTSCAASELIREQRYLRIGQLPHAFSSLKRASG